MNRRPAGSAHTGLGEWLVQRLTAIYLAGFVVWLSIRFAMAPFPDQVSWKAWVASGEIRLAFAVFILSLLLHAWVGMRSVLLDYLKPLWLRFLVQSCVAGGLAICGLWAIQLLLLDAVR